MKKLLLGLIFSVLCAAPAFAHPQCYSPTELQAEQLIRLHSELMVIAVICHQGSQGQDLVNAYAGFTRNNLAVLRDAEQTMIHEYKIDYRDNGIPHLDALRTMLGNAYSQLAADVSAPVFCRRQRDLVTAFSYFTPGQFQSVAQHMIIADSNHRRLCHLPAITDADLAGEPPAIVVPVKAPVFAVQPPVMVMAAAAIPAPKIATPLIADARPIPAPVFATAPVLNAAPRAATGFATNTNMNLVYHAPNMDKQGG